MIISRKISTVFLLAFTFSFLPNYVDAIKSTKREHQDTEAQKTTETKKNKRSYQEFLSKSDEESAQADHSSDEEDEDTEQSSKIRRIATDADESEGDGLDDDDLGLYDLEHDLANLPDDDLEASYENGDDLPSTPIAHNDTEQKEQPQQVELAVTAEQTEFEKKITAIQSFPEIAKVVNELLIDSMRGDNSTTGQMKRKRLKLLIALPWLRKDENNINLFAAKHILDHEHYGLEKVKQRVIEHLAVQKRKKDSMGTIICLVGPPGVGKTTLASSIAKAVGRKFVKAAFGGVHDESAIRGYPPSYQSAGPGKIIDAMIKANVVNPVILLDEIDKLGHGSHNGSPADALLEVLDPSQNKEFQDHFMGVPYDLSNVMFIASANSLDTIPAPLMDRMEVIQLSSYTSAEKFEIAKRHLMPKVFHDVGLHDGELVITDDAVKRLIHDYTCEAGVRQLGRVIAKLSRKIITLNLMDKPQNFVIEPHMLVDHLEHPHVRLEKPLDFDMVGHTQGLSVSMSGGHMLPVEVKVVPGQGKIIRTGKMGDVMKESAEAAMTVVRDRLGNYGIKPKKIKRKDFHVHFYAAAIPKDGPSAGLAMATTIMSAVTGRPVNRLVCMTGEISLHGKALPIGGLKEKLIAAHRAGMETAIIPEANIIDLVDVPDEVRQELEIIAVKDISEVLDIALLDVV